MIDSSAGSEPVVADGRRRRPRDTPRGGPLSQPYRWLSIGMFALIFIAAFEVMAVTTIMPLVAEELHGESLFALAFSVPFAAGVVGMVASGNWADRSGPLPPLIAAGVLFSIGLVIAGLALYVIVARVYPEHLRARVFAGFAAAWVIPSIVGPAVAGVIAEQASWRWVFLGVIVLVLPAAGMMLRPLLRVHDLVAGDPTVRWSLSRLGWSVLAAAGALGVSLAKELGEPWRWVVAAAAIAVAVVAVRPLLPAGTLRAARGMPATVLLRAVVAGAFFGSEIYLPYLLIDRYEFSPSLAGVVLTGAGLSWAAASWVQGRLGERMSNTDAVRVGTGVLAVALVAVLAVSAFSLAPAVAFVAWTAAGAGMGFMYPRFSVAVLELSAKSAQGFNSAALNIGEALSSAIALAITALVASVAGTAAFTADFVVTVLIALVGVVLAPRMRPAGEGGGLRYGVAPAASVD